MLKRIAIIAGGAIVILGVGWVTWSALRSPRSATNATPTNVEVLPLLYHDPDFKFSLTFPETWSGYRTTRVRTDAYEYVAFTHPTKVSKSGNPGKAEFSVLVIRAAGTALPEGATLLAEREGVRYAAVISALPAPDELAQLKEAIPGILATFTLTD